MKLLLLLFVLSDNLWAQTTPVCELRENYNHIYGRLVSVGDGDTIRVAVNIDGKIYKNSVRLLGIDTPESHYQGHSQGQWATAATNSLRNMINFNEIVLLEFEEKPCDSYGRFVAKVRTNKYEVNLEQIKRGLAATYCYKNVTQTCLEYSKAMKVAMDRKRGMYSDPNLVLPYVFRNQVNEKARTAYVMNLQTKEVFDFEEIYKIPPHLIVFIPWSQ